MRNQVLILGAAIAALSMVSPPPAGTATRGRHIEGGILDDIELKADSIPADATVVVRKFSNEHTDLGTGAAGGKEKRVAVAEQMKDECPDLLAKTLVAKLKALGPFPQVRLDDGSPPAAGTVVIEGEIVVLNPGSRAKRYWAGFGAGKSDVQVEGTVADGGGDPLADFKQRRIGVMGVGGGSSEKKLSDDCGLIGEDIAKFLSTWARGGSLRD